MDNQSEINKELNQKPHPLNRNVHPHFSKAALFFIAIVGLGVTFMAVFLSGQQQDPRSRASEKTTVDNSLNNSPKEPSVEETIKDKYIVVLKENAPGKAQEVASDMAKSHGLSSEHIYTHALKGFSAHIPQARLDKVKSDPRVDYVEVDSIVTVQATPQILPVGVDKVEADLSSTLAGNGSGTVEGVDVYVIDTGIDVAHTDLNVVEHVSFAGGKGGNTDCNGHGTHVAGIVGAKDNDQDVVGVAPGARLHGFKTGDCSGKTSASKIISAVDRITASHAPRSVANMSLGGVVSTSMDTAVRNLAASGVTVVVSAGNNGLDACERSPSRAGTTEGVITVGMTTVQDLVVSQSNWGPCVDIWAPTGVATTHIGGGIINSFGGTSAAAPHVAGAAALLLSRTPQTPAQVEASIKASATNTGNIRYGLPVFRLNVSTY